MTRPTGKEEVFVDVLVAGGGAAGLWLLESLLRSGYRAALLEARALGSGQTIGSQGILHGGFKYSFHRSARGSAASVRSQTAVWDACLAGTGLPDLSGVVLRSPACHAWVVGRAGKILLMGAASLFRRPLAWAARDERPGALRRASGVLRVEEVVIEPASFLESMARACAGHLFKVDVSALDVETSAQGPDAVRIAASSSGRSLLFRARRLVLTAGEGNEAWRSRLGLTPVRMQRRPLHMVMCRGGSLPVLNGHQLGWHLRYPELTVTTTTDAAGRNVWQIGGRVAEVGAAWERRDVIEASQALCRPLLGSAGRDLEWSSYRIDRAEGTTPGGRRPQGPTVFLEGPVVTAWPTKLVLVPELVRMVSALLPEPEMPGSLPNGADLGWPVPEIARGPWEEATWSRGASAVSG